MALTLANRTIPSSCLSLITLSPRPGGTLPPVMQQRFHACLFCDKLPSRSIPST
jgi:hypothetical protein